jgi:hypothetical protein
MFDTERTGLSWPDLMSAHFDLQPAIAACGAASAGPRVLLVQPIARQRGEGKTKIMMPFIPCQRLAASFFGPIVKWITFAHRFPGHCVIHRMAQANFNIRGLARPLALYCADGLVFSCRIHPKSPTLRPLPITGSSQAGDLRSAGFVCWMRPPS